MPQVAVKRIREKSLNIQNGWNEGAAAVTEFRNTTNTAFDAKITEGLAADDAVEALEAQLTIARDNRDDIWSQADDMCVDIREGVAGHKDYGNDSPLYDSMGFTRKSEKDSGLTHKIKTEETDTGENP